MNKLLLVLIGVLLLLALTAQFFPTAFFLDGLNWGDYFLTIAEAFGLVMMMGNGTFMDTRYYKIFRVAAIIIPVGIGMKILHWMGADQVVLISFLAVPLLYSFHFLSKKEKGRLDFLKLLTVFAFFIQTPLLMVHIIPLETIRSIVILPHVIFWITLIDFLIVEFKKETLFRN